MNKIIKINIEDLKEYENNVKNHPEFQINNIKDSIKEFGFTQPILIDENNIIIAGHGRYMAATELKLQTVPVIVIDYLTEDQKKAYRLIDNKLLLDTEMDLELVAEEFSELESKYSDRWYENYMEDLYDDIFNIIEEYAEEDRQNSQPEKKVYKYICSECGEEFEVEYV